MLIEYPIGWKPVASSTQIPGLAIEHPQLIVPARPQRERRADRRHAGGRRTRPASQAVRRRSEPAAADDRRRSRRSPGLQVRAVQRPRRWESRWRVRHPQPRRNPRRWRAMRPRRASRYMRQCEQAVSGVTVVGQVAGLPAGARTGIRRQDQRGDPAARSPARLAQARTAAAGDRRTRRNSSPRRLADGFAQAGASVANLEASAAVAARAGRPGVLDPACPRRLQSARRRRRANATPPPTPQLRSASRRPNRTSTGRCRTSSCSDTARRWRRRRARKR